MAKMFCMGAYNTWGPYAHIAADSREEIKDKILAWAKDYIVNEKEPKLYGSVERLLESYFPNLDAAISNAIEVESGVIVYDNA